MISEINKIKAEIEELKELQYKIQNNERFYNYELDIDVKVSIREKIKTSLTLVNGMIKSLNGLSDENCIYTEDCKCTICIREIELNNFKEWLEERA